MYFSAHTFVNSPFIKFSSNGPSEAGYGLPAGPGNHPNGIETPTLAGTCVLQYSPAPKPTSDLLLQASLWHLFNYLAPVDVCAYNLCPGVGKWLPKTVPSNSDITQPKLERLTCIYGSPHHYPFSLTRQFPLKWQSGSNNQKYNRIITFQETPYWKQSYKFKKQSRGKKRKAFIWCMNILGTVERLWNQTDLSSNIS